MTRRQLWAKERADALAWMQQCGGDLLGYIIRYGSAHDPVHYGDGGEAIYAADLAHLHRCEELAR